MFVTEVVSLIEGEWSCYRGGHFNGEKMVTLPRWSVYWKENGHVTEVVTLMEGKWSCYRSGNFNGGRMVMSWRLPV